MLLPVILMSAAVAQTPTAGLTRTTTMAVRAQVAATCRVSAREMACRDAAQVAPLVRRYDAAGGRLIIEF
jgi:hypothetical protein